MIGVTNLNPIFRGERVNPNRKLIMGCTVSHRDRRPFRHTVIISLDRQVLMGESPIAEA